MRNELETLMLIPLYYHSPEESEMKIERKLKRQITIDRFTTEESVKEVRNFFFQRNPQDHKFNEILGYAELRLDLDEILVFYHLNGDGRKKYNKNNNWRLNSKRIYEALNYDSKTRLKSYESIAILGALSNCMDKIEIKCKEWNVYVDTSDERERMKYFDFISFFERTKYSCDN